MSGRGAALIVALAAAAGCYRGGGASGECEIVCVDDAECPAGLVCGLAGRCVGMREASCADLGPDGPPRDAEPPPDARDCRLGGDEDSDGTVNGCDLCPINSNLNNFDGDEVGQSCDPRDGGGGGPERHVFFDGFETVVKRYDQAGAWMATLAGDGDVTTMGMPDLAHLTWRLPGLPEHIQVAASLTVHQIGGAQPWIAVGRAIGGTSAQDAAGQGCRLSLGNPGEGALVDLPSTNHATGAVPFLVEERLQVAAWWSPTDGTQCRFGNIDAPSPSPFGTVLTAPSDNQVGVIVHDASVTIHWLMVVESQ